MINNNEPLITVIMPAYNVESFLERSVNSVRNQYYKNLDILIIDDGSKDKTLQIAYDLASKDARIRVIHQNNQGVSVARNVGLDNTLGEYVMFVDTDDFIDPEMCSELMNAMLSNDVDIVSVNSYTERYGKIIRKNTTGSFITREHPQIMDFYLSDNDGVVWGKLYKKSVIGNVRFPVGRLFEDCAALYRIIENAHKVGYIDKQLYCYYKNPNSISHTSFNLQKRYEYYLAYKERYEYARNRELKSMLLCEGLMVKAALSAMTAAYANGASEDDWRVVELVECVKEHRRPETLGFMNLKYRIFARCCGKVDFIHKISSKLSKMSKLLKK
ncbi:glycosyltransferase [uncultured Phascolarctobacterium sp.]|uniref:glycosyltransferase family 2 protein n=1 Tax=uncultured Phascolarctobacterium sp. TaxID=512296 RepID=UPI0026309932|nr:glycosyltransferase [uncultured Phascolarctobacterium sp.]